MKSIIIYTNIIMYEVGVASGSGWNLWVWLVGGMYGCGYQEVGVVGKRWVWLAGGIYGCGYQEVGVVSSREAHNMPA